MTFAMHIRLRTASAPRRDPSSEPGAEEASSGWGYGGGIGEEAGEAQLAFDLSELWCDGAAEGAVQSLAQLGMLC